MSHSEELLNRVRNITSSTMRQIENSNNVDRDNLDFCIRQFDQIVRHLQHILNVDSPIADQLAAILLNIETISKTFENSVHDNRLSIECFLRPYLFPLVKWIQMHNYCENASNITQNSSTWHVRIWNYPKNILKYHYRVKIR